MGEIAANLEHWAETLMGGWWIYPVLLGFCAFDAVVPALPSESLVIAATVYSRAHGEPALPLVALAACLGAILGDHLAYVIGRTFSAPAMRFMGRGRRRTKALTWATNGMAKRGGSLLVMARFVPGGRTALTMTMGATHYPLRRFTPWVVIAGVLWSIYGVVLGLASVWLSTAFGIDVHDHPLITVAVGIVLGVAATGLIELVRARRERAVERASSPADEEDPARLM